MQFLSSNIKKSILQSNFFWIVVAVKTGIGNSFASDNTSTLSTAISMVPVFSDLLIVSGSLFITVPSILITVSITSCLLSLAIEYLFSQLHIELRHNDPLINKKYIAVISFSIYPPS